MTPILSRERPLLLAVAGLVLLMNVPHGELLLYPFALFSTWVHECFHGLAALAVGGEVGKLYLYPDTSGTTWSYRPSGVLPSAIIASAGYVGTAVSGGFALALRRLPGIGRVGTVVLGVLMLVTAALWVRNLFGLAVTLAGGAALIGAGIRLSEGLAAQLFTFLAAATSLNAFTSIQDLFSANLLVNGQPSGSDASRMAELLWLPSWFWASLWLLLAAASISGGLFLAITPERWSRGG